LIKIIAGEISPDSGHVAVPSGASVGYVAQELNSAELHMSLEGFVLDVLPSWREFWEQWQVAVKNEDAQALARLGVRQHELEITCGYNPEHQAKAILQGLGFTQEQCDQPLQTLSGGWRERAKLARVLVAGADILLLDEPTNHLDLEAVTWLERYLFQYKGVLIFVAHDRFFLDNIGNKILFLGGEKPIVRPGNLKAFLLWHHEHEAAIQLQAARISAEIAKKESFISRFRYKATKAVQAQSRIKQVDKLKRKLEEFQPEQMGASLSFHWPTPSRGNKTVLGVSDLSFAYPEQPCILQNITFHLYRGQKIALAGPNGQGKSTLIKLVIGQLTPDAGTVDLGSLSKVGYFSQHQADMLCLQNSVLSEIRRLSDPKTTEEELRSVLGRFMLGQHFWDKKVSDLSGGEKNRLVLASLFLARANFFILDEPTNHLDLESREALVQALQDFSGTILFVAHDRYLLDRVAEEVWELKNKGLIVHAGGFSAYQASCQACKDKENSSAVLDLARANRKEQKRLKRLQAEQRNQAYKLLKPLKEKFSSLETELEANLEEQERLESLLADPTTYADTQAVKQLNVDFAKAQAAGDRLMTDMAYLEKEMQEIEGQKLDTEK
jgi:ATP-binding cassette subfamily F protein 3